MSNYIRKTIPMAVALALAVGAPGVASAQECVDEYQRCLNDTHDTRGVIRVMADVECFAKYVGCIRRQVME